ncbi:hypothetical protein [Peribacillus kribbensis]|uniref:hypothetical protein n=1 Tax=Peribacillus kribbensis TaxID=356658 RepID=UPI00042400DC|nr:hypothetical protein [Peribacillus kribbensis]
MDKKVKWSIISISTASFLTFAGLVGAGQKGGTSTPGSTSGDFNQDTTGHSSTFNNNHQGQRGSFNSDDQSLWGDDGSQDSSWGDDSTFNSPQSGGFQGGHGSSGSSQ